MTVRKAGGRSVTVRRYGSEVPALYSPGGSVKCSQMPEGGLVIVQQLDASSFYL